MIEGIVRPFQSPQVTQSGPIPVPSVGPTRPASIKWGAVGKLPQPYVSFTVAPDETYTEQSRSTDTVRVYNPQDSSQYADVQRTDKLTMSKASGSSVLSDSWTADIAQAFSDFSAEVQAAFNNADPGTPGATTSIFVFRPPA